MSAMIQTLTQQNQEYMQTINSKVLELQSKERIAAMEQKTQLTVELMKHDAADSRIAFQAEQDHIDRRLDLLQQNLPITADAGQAQQPPAQSANVQQPTGGQSPGQPMGAP